MRQVCYGPFWGLELGLGEAEKNCPDGARRMVFHKTVRSVVGTSGACYLWVMKKRIHDRTQIDGDVAARQEGFGPASDRHDLAASSRQSGDLQGISGVADADSESVQELIEEGQYYEAAVVSGVEDAPDADEGPIKTREVAEDDVPAEYTDQDSDEPKE